MSRRKTTEQVVGEFRERLGDRWDYSNTEYVDATTPMRITCPEHGDFFQFPNNHKRGFIGCGGCSGRAYTTQDFIRESTQVHGDLWSYSETEYVNNHTPVVIICRQHGAFTQHPRSHRRGHNGCPKCNRWSVSVEQFKEQSPYADEFDYSKVDFTKVKEKATITCLIHGDFEQVVDSHLRGFVGCRGCQSTGSSKGEKEVADFIRGLGADVETNVTGLLSNPRYEIDVYLPGLQLGLEFNGLYYHSEKYKTLRYHFDKYEDAQKNGIRLVQVWEDDWGAKRAIIEEHLRQVLGRTALPKVGARQTVVSIEEPWEAQRFLNAYHIQGYLGASIHLGLRKEGELVAIGSFKKRGKDYDLVRYATSNNVQGGHSKLISFFERNYTYSTLITFADRTFSDGGLYRTTGWKEDGIVRPDYFYLYRGKRHHKFNFRLKRFREDPALKYVEGMTERELAQINGLLRVYDAGKIRFVRPHPTVPEGLDSVVD